MLKRLNLKTLSMKNKIERTVSYALEMVLLILLGAGLAKAGDMWIGALMIAVAAIIALSALHHYILTPYFTHLTVTESLVAKTDSDALSVTENFVKGRRRDILSHMDEDAIIHNGAILKVKPEGERLRITSFLFRIKQDIRIDDRFCVARNPIEFFKIQKLAA